jgi:hypothetical protein
MTELSFANKLYAHLAEGITAGQTTLPIVPGEMGNIWAGFKPGVYLYLTIMNELGQIEIIKVTDINNNSVTAVRGQDGTLARAFSIGSPIAERFVAEQMSFFLQRGVFRQVAYNPNGVLTADFNGEKFWQTGPAADQKRWWINAGATNKWRLLTGDLYGNEYRDAEGFIFPPPPWELVAPAYGGEYYIRHMIEFGGYIYGVTSWVWTHGGGGALLRWNGVDAWDLVAPVSTFSVNPAHLTKAGIYLFAPTGGGCLQRWNNFDAWTNVTSAWSQSLTSSFYYGGEIYCVDYFGLLKKWNGVADWAADPSQPTGGVSAQTGESFFEIGGNLYCQSIASTIQEWPGSGSWSTVVTPGVWLSSFVVVGVLAYAYESAGSALYEIDVSGGTATLVAAAIPAALQLTMLINFLDEVYGLASTGDLYHWTGTAWEIWVEKATPSPSNQLALATVGLDVFSSGEETDLYRCTP